ncbi:MAG: peptidase MA family metallohydrolase [Anaerolineales bacterium]|nr:peptidase MA family metallohydrolase [Anaerolineales bacterium]
MFFREGSSEFTHVAVADLTDGSTILAEVTEESQTLGVEPFTTITYWWQIDFADSDNYFTDPASFVYEDNRFVWQSLGNTNITVHWVEGDISRGQEILNLANDSLTRIQRNLALPGSNPLNLYIYPSVGQLQSSMRMGGAKWIGGHSYPELGAVLLAAPNGVEGQISLERDIPHELVHILLYERMGDQYHNLPTWLNEGLAALQEGVPNPAYIFELDRAARDNTLISMHSLCASFPISEEDALLAYAQSASFTQYLLDIYGVGGVALLLDAYQEGTSCEGGIQRVYQRPIAQLESEWRWTTLSNPNLLDFAQPLLPWLLLGVSIIAVFGIVFLLSRRQNKG